MGIYDVWQGKPGYTSEPLGCGELYPIMHCKSIHQVDLEVVYFDPSSVFCGDPVNFGSILVCVIGVN